jgi:hypothetical protein
MTAWLLHVRNVFKWTWSTHLQYLHEVCTCHKKPWRKFSTKNPTWVVPKNHDRIVGSIWIDRFTAGQKRKIYKNHIFLGYSTVYIMQKCCLHYKMIHNGLPKIPLHFISFLYITLKSVSRIQGQQTKSQGPHFFTCKCWLPHTIIQGYNIRLANVGQPTFLAQTEWLPETSC